MTLSKVVSFLSNSTVTESKAGPAFRVREAAREQVPLEQLVQQMRQMFTAPHERLCEARFDEMLDILDEQRSATNDELDSLGRRVITLNTRVDENHSMLSEVFSDALAKSRDDLELKISKLSASLHQELGELDKRLRESLQDLARSLAQHVSDNDAKRQTDREQSMMSLEQRIAQWRAEIDDTRRDDMQEVASSMMNIGQRLMTLRKM